jgi:hypothetical protein
MSRIGRNDPCPCGSGKKYKHCCARKPQPAPDKVIGYALDAKNELILTYTKDMLVNQLRRDSVRIAESFDRLCEDCLEEVSELMSRTMMILHQGLVVGSRGRDELRQTCVEMLMNAGNSLTAAATLLRCGFRLQPGILVRNVIETIGAVLHLFTYPADLEAFRQGRIKSSKTISTAKKAIPPFGQLYGFFSQEFVHIGSIQQQLQPLIPYEEFDDALTANVCFLRLSVWLLYVSTELLCLDIVREPRYWRCLGEAQTGQVAYAYDPCPSERAWLGQFLADCVDFENRDDTQ